MFQLSVFKDCYFNLEEVLYMNGSTRTTLGENAYYKLDLILVLRIITKNNIYGGPPLGRQRAALTAALDARHRGRP